LSLSSSSSSSPENRDVTWDTFRVPQARQDVTNTQIFWPLCTQTAHLCVDSCDFKHLFHRDAKPSSQANKKFLTNVCRQEVTACFTSASVANHLPVRCFLRGQNSCKLVGTAGSVVHNPHYTLKCSKISPTVHAF
jgi:hypothetical protein